MATVANKISTPRRQWLFRVCAVLLGLFAVLLVEGLLGLTNLGRINDIGDPFVGFSENRPLFVLNEATQRFEIPESRQTFFQPDSFAAKKKPNEFRIFCLGGSTVQGRPYSIETSFTTWLELSLNAADPSKQWQTVNCGGVSYASYRLVPIMRETLKYDPDMFIVYTGHNEFLEERTYSNMKHQPRWLLAAQERLSRSRIYGVAWQLLASTEKHQEPVNMPAEVDALLDYQGGLAKYHRNDALRRQIVEHYGHNLRRMTRLARNAEVPLVFVNPVSNIRDTPPFKVELPTQLSDQQRGALVRYWEQAKEASWEDLSLKKELVNRVLAIDNGHAEAHFLLGKIHDSLGDTRNAKSEYLLAKDTDVCPLRMLESMHRELTECARLTGTPLLDARRLFVDTAEQGLPGDEQLIDHVHPNIEGHQKIAELLFDHMVEENLLVPEIDWRERQNQRFKENYASLPENYFPESVARLRGLQKWTQGRVLRLKIEGEE